MEFRGFEKRASRYLPRSESTYEGKRYRSRSPLTRSDKEDEKKKSSDRVRGSTDALKNGRVARKRKSEEQDSEHLRKRPTLAGSQGDVDPLKKPSQPQQPRSFIAPLPKVLSTSGSAGPSQKGPSSSVLRQQTQEENGKTGAVSQKRKVEEQRDSERPHKKIRKEDPPSPITPDFRAIKVSDPSQKCHVSQKRKGDVRKSRKSRLQKTPKQPSKNIWCDSQRLPSYSTVQAQKKSAEKPQKPQSNFQAIKGLPYLQGPKLGQGGFGTVHAGTRVSDGLEVAIKYVPKELADMVEDSQTGLMPLEVALMLRVSSSPACPNIIRLLEWFEQPKHYVMILERPDPCEDLIDFADRNEDTDEEMAKEVTLQLVKALKHCESRGVLHRDVKPENILVRTDTCEVKLLDFSCGDFLKDSYREFSGTAVYAPPELFLTRQYHARPTTVWSVGITLYNVLSGSVPFLNRKEIINNEPFLPDFISEECRHLVQWCLDKNPDNRPSLEEIERHPWFQ